MRIEVGYGWKNAHRRGERPDHPQPDDAAVQSGDYDGGVEAGIEAIVGLLEGGAAPPPTARRAAPPGIRLRSFDESDLPWPMRILLGAFISESSGCSPSSVS